MRYVGCCLRDAMQVNSSVIITNLLAPGEGCAISPQSAPKQSITFYDVACIYHNETWYVYNVDCYYFPYQIHNTKHYHFYQIKPFLEVSTM